MSVFDHPSFDDHEHVVFGRDRHSGLSAIIAIHDTSLGPSLGGCRMYAYANSGAALTDVLRLARGMSYKAAIAELPLGGGKSVIIGDPHTGKSPALMHAMGDLVERLHGRYIIAEDSGTGVEDMRLIAERTAHVSGITDKAAADGTTRSGDPSPATAHGVFVGIKAAVKHRLGRNDLAGVRVAVQGAGHVGQHLIKQLVGAGAQVWAADVWAANAEAAGSLGATVVPADTVLGLDVDVLAPCALGAIINDETLSMMKAGIVAGAANNQLAEDRHGQLLHDRGVLFAPDYVINAGGLIDVYYERSGFDRERLIQHVERIGENLEVIFQRAEGENRPTSAVADQMARERIGRG